MKNQKYKEVINILIPSNREISLVENMIKGIIKLRTTQRIFIFICRNTSLNYSEVKLISSLNILNSWLSIDLRFLESKNIGQVYKYLLSKPQQGCCFFYEDDDILLNLPDAFDINDTNLQLRSYIPHKISDLIGINKVKETWKMKEIISWEIKYGCFQIQQMIFDQSFIKYLDNFDFNNNLANDFKIFCIFLEHLDQNNKFIVEKIPFFIQRASEQFKNISFSEFNKDPRWKMK